MSLRRLLTETDLAAGLVAVLVLVAGALWLRSPWVSILPAVLVYLGLRLLLVRHVTARTAERQEAVEVAAAQVAQLGQLAVRIPKAEVRQQVEAICDRMRRVLAVIQEDELDVWVARDLSVLYIMPTLQQLDAYVPLATRNVSVSQAEQVDVEERVLPLMAHALDMLFQKVHRSRIINARVASEVINDLHGELAPPETVRPSSRAGAVAERTQDSATGGAVTLQARPQGAPAGEEDACASEQSHLPPLVVASTPAASASAGGLSPREVEVLGLISIGRSNKEIAAELSLSVRTVERHITNIYTKIGARNRADATNYALAHSLIPNGYAAWLADHWLPDK